ncbi:N-acetylglucosamine-6-phosphate deacetylase [Vibrio sp. WJH972]
MTYALVNGVIYTGEQVFEHSAIIVSGDKILDIVPIEKLDNQIDTIDLDGATISPGFIDLQLNGCGGVMFNDNISVDTLRIMHNANLHSGCCQFLPTLITSTNQDMVAAINCVRDYQQQFPNHIPGIHLEGPYISIEKRGIHNSEHIRKVDPEMLEFLLENRDVIKKITLDPENNLSTIKTLSDCGIIVSLGHSNCSFSQAKEAFSNGASFVTHLFNAMSQWSGREPGLVGAAFDTPSVYAGIIADGHHVDYASIRVSHKIMTDRLILVTDATAPAGSEIDNFLFVGKKVYYKDGKCIDENGTLGGSALTMIEAVQNCVEQVGIPLDEALRMATLYPAMAISIDTDFATIEVGKFANLTIFDNQYNVLATVVNGHYEQNK